MARKRHSDEDVLKLLREIELKLAAGDDLASACRSVGISDATATVGVRGPRVLSFTASDPLHSQGASWLAETKPLLKL